MRTFASGRVLRSMGSAWGLFVAAVVLAGCGAQTSTPPGPTVIGRNCGEVSIGAANPAVSGAAGSAENCLWQAWTHCQKATLTLTQFGVDTGVTHTITVQPAGNGCGVTDAAQRYMVPSNTHQPVVTYTCAGLKRAADGGLLAHGCGADGDLTIPPPTPTPTATA